MNGAADDSDAERLLNDLADPAADWIELVRRAERPRSGGRLGPYEILDELGRGAQGLVFRARQPSTGREIALKRLVGGSLSTPAARRRFEREVELAASLVHPGIVTVLGVEEVDGATLLAMEWVEGRSLTEWSAAQAHGRAGLVARLELFLQVCAAVEYAHGRGVIHRDLKPSNILVDASGRCRLLDFGLARRLELEDETTRTLGFVGTPAYAAPESFTEGRAPLDVRSDVYSLGVVLYELLTGERPFQAPLLPDLMREIAEREPRRPSSLANDLDAELDAVVLKACAKRPEERYPTGHALAEDLRRYLEGRSVLAVPPRTSYLVRKWIARNRLAAGELGALVLSLIALAVVGFAQAESIRRQRDRAQKALDLSQHQAAMAFRVQEFYLEAINHSAADVRERDVSSVLNYLEEHLREAFRDYPDVAADLLRDLARSRMTLRDFGHAKELALEGLALLDGVADPDLASRATLESTVADTLMRAGDYQGARERYRRAVDYFHSYLERLDRGERADRIEGFRPMERAVALDYTEAFAGSLGMAEAQLGHVDEAMRQYAEALRISHELGNAVAALEIVRLRAILLSRAGELDKAESELRAALADVERAAPADDSETRMAMGQARTNLAYYIEPSGRTAEALELQRSGLADMREVLPAGDMLLWPELLRLGELLVSNGRHEEALGAFAEVEDTAEGPGYVVRARACRALSLRALGRLDEAADAFAAALPGLGGVLDGDRLRARTELAAMSTFVERERFEEAEALFPTLIAELTAGARRGERPEPAALERLRADVASIGYEAELDEAVSRWDDEAGKR